MNEQETIEKFYDKLDEIAQISDENKELVIEALDLLGEWLTGIRGKLG